MEEKELLEIKDTEREQVKGNMEGDAPDKKDWQASPFCTSLPF